MFFAILLLVIGVTAEKASDLKAVQPPVSPSLLQRGANYGTGQKHEGLHENDPDHLHVQSEPEHVGGLISEDLHDDLLGDALEPTEGGKGEKGHGNKAGHSDGYKTILMFFGSLFIGAVLLVALERYLPSLPYTVAMFISGILFACWHFSRTPASTVSWHSWFRSVEMWESINPHLMFYTFLPPLLFCDAMKLNVQLVKKCFWQVFLLACPGVLLGTGLVGMVARYVLPYGWSWAVSLTFGSVLSATDPVAVVALFSTLGVSPRLTMLVAGESLMNDGTAIVVFSLMLKVVLGAELNMQSVMVFFSHMTLTSVLTGGALGFLAVAVIGKCSEERFHSDGMIQVVTTLCCAYLSFFIAESELATSGVLATVTSGLVVACYAWPLFTSLETIEIVWETVEFVANTVIFFLAGLLFADTVLDSLSIIGPSDFGWLLVLYAFLIFIRALMVGILWIPLNKAGKPIDWREAVAMIYSGLRGAVSLALAIIIDEEPGVSKEMGARIMFHVGGIAALTLLVNATTAASLLRYLGLAGTSKAGEQKVAVFATHLADHAKTAFKAQQDSTDARFDGVDEIVLQAMVPALVGTADGSQAKTSSEMAESAQARTSDVGESESAQTYREAFLNVVKHHYWHAIEEGIIPRSSKSARILLNSIDEALDNASERLNDVKIVLRDLDHGPGILGDAAQSLLVGSNLDGAMQKVYCILSFMHAHQEAQREVPLFFDASSSQVQDTVAGESKAQTDEAKHFLDKIPADMVKLGKTEMLARKLLHNQLSEVDKLKERGLLASADASKLEHGVQAALLKLLHCPKEEWLSNKPAQSTLAST